MAHADRARSLSGPPVGSTSMRPQARLAATSLTEARPEEAAEICRRIREGEPEEAYALYLLGMIAYRKGRLEPALALVDEAIARHPGAAHYHNDRAVILQRQGRRDEAIAAFDRAIRIKPDFAEAHTNRGVTLLHQRRAEEALAAHDEALRLAPELPLAHLNRGGTLRQLGRLKEALAACDQALRIRPHFAQAHNNRGNILQDQGRFAEALAAYQQARKAEPNYASAHSNYLFCLNYDPAQDDATLSAAHQAWGERHGRHPRAFTTYRNAPDPDKTLVVGLFSPDLGRHPVGYFLQPLLASTSADQVRFVCYSGRLLDDDLTEQLKGCAAAWRSTLGLSEVELATAVRADGVDILIDLVGHTGGNRLDCFALRPAPVQIHWAGYCHSVPSMDYSLWDPIQVPEGAGRWFVEPVIRLPDLRWCYGPPEYAPKVTKPPALHRGYITFGSFNNLVRVNAEVIDLWARVLQEVPDSRLLLSWPTLSDAHEAERLSSLFTAREIPADRLELRPGASSHAGVLAEYGDVDIALDPFPFSGRFGWACQS